MSRAAGLFLNGLLALVLALVIWRLTHSVIGWAILFAPGSALVFWGWAVALRAR